MLVKTLSIACIGLDTSPVDVEVDITQRALPSFEIVGLPDKSISESRHRIKTALANTLSSFPPYRIIVNLAPADLPKEGSVYDLAIAASILAAIHDLQIPPRSIFYGELSLDGGVRHTKGAILAAHFASKAGYTNLFLPSGSANQASAVAGVQIIPLHSLRELLHHLDGRTVIRPSAGCMQRLDPPVRFDPELTDVVGQHQGKRAIQLAAAGGHNLFMVGAAGSGKSMLARSIRSISSPLSFDEGVEVTKIHSVVGATSDGEGIITTAPFRAPHHTTSTVGLIGGGRNPRPGEISLAHRGVLFLDELFQFSRQSLDALRQPLEEGVVTLSRGAAHISFPARFTLIGAANPCPCGHFGDPKIECSCSPHMIAAYRKRLTGPMLDRIDISIQIAPVSNRELFHHKPDPSLDLDTIRRSVADARALARARLRSTGLFSNGEMRSQHIKELCTLSPQARQLLVRAHRQFNLSVRAVYKLIKLAQTMADFEYVEQHSDALSAPAPTVMITNTHLLEALQFKGHGEQ